MKNLLIILTIFCALNAHGQNYQITFAGTGASTTVSSVKVENLTSGTTVNITGSDILHLTAISTGVNSEMDDLLSEIKIYPNPMSDYGTVQISPPASGEAVITILDMTGKPVTQAQYFLENSVQSFRLSGLNYGIYFIDVKGLNYKLSGKLVSNGNASGKICFEKISGLVQADESKKPGSVNKGSLATIDMTYTTGDRLRFTGISGVYKTIITDIPASDKTITFSFLECKDADNNNYPIVTINNQFWMAENLKSLKYRNGDLIGTTTPATLDISGESTPKYQWPYDGNESNVATYGRLYTWYTVTDSRNVCPVGWHVPTNNELTVLTDYLTNNGYGYQGSGNDIGKSMASISGWNTDPTAGNVGNSQVSNNSSGFNGLPGGYRDINGTFLSIGSGAFWWSSIEFSATNAYARAIRSYNNYADNFYHSKKYGNSVRCLKD